MLNSYFSRHFVTLFVGVFVIIAFALPMYFDLSDDYNLDRMNNATVLVEVDGGHGSGVLIAPDKILTAAHVVGAGGDVTITFKDGSTRNATVSMIGTPTNLDAAILTLDSPVQFTPVSLACDKLEINDELIAIGNPGAARWVSSVLRVAADSTWPGGSTNTVIVQGPLIPGMSGGPVYNSNGDVVGITHALYLMALGFSAAPNGLSAIVPASAICDVTINLN